MECPFCAQEMHPGLVGVRSYRGVRQDVEWHPDDRSTQRSWWRRMLQDEGPGRVVVPASVAGHNRRSASYCETCHAVVVHPPTL